MREKTCVVDGSREASKVEAIRAAFVDREAVMRKSGLPPLMAVLVLVV